MDILRKLFKLGESPPPATLSTNEEHYLESWPGYFLIAEVRDPQGRADDKATQILDNAGLSSVKHRRIHDFPNETELAIAKQIDNNGYRIPIRSITLVFGGLTAEELMQLERPLRDAWHQIKVLKTGNYSLAQAQANPIDKVKELEAVCDVTGLVNMLEDYNYYVQVAAAEALGRLGDKSAVKPLINALKGERNSTGVRQAAAEALGRIGDKSAIKPLKALLKDARYYVRLGAETASDQLQE